jgi:hypothetical protein
LTLPAVVLQLRLAEELQRRLEAGEVPNRAALARQERLTRARVTQLMNLLVLHPVILEYLRGLAPGRSSVLITERRLRRVAKQSPADQLRLAEKTITGLLAWRRSRRAA